VPGSNFNDREEGVLFPALKKRSVKAYDHFTYLQAYRDTRRHKIAL